MASSREDCKKWKDNPLKNPLTNRSIKQNGPTFTKLSKSCLEIDRKHLANILDKSLKSRSDSAKIMSTYLRNVQPCLTKVNNKLCLVDAQGNVVLQFDKRIGSNSVYGMAYLNYGKGLARILKCSCKIMENTPNNRKEIKLLEEMTELVKQDKTPNMPFIYKSNTCESLCDFSDCPKVAEKSHYIVVASELASFDLLHLLKQPQTKEVLESIAMQIICSISSFHSLKYTHNDTHLGNFLVHKVKPGGCWRYEIAGHTIYVPNTGYLLVLWDPGLATPKVTRGKMVYDYSFPFKIMCNIPIINDYNKGLINTAEYENDMKVLKINQKYIDDFIYPIYYNLNVKKKEEDELLSNLFERIKSNQIPMSTIIIDDKPSTYLLNIKPYKN